MSTIDGATSAIEIAWSDVSSRGDARGRVAAAGRAALSISWRMNLLARRETSPPTPLLRGEGRTIIPSPRLRAGEGVGGEVLILLTHAGFGAGRRERLLRRGHILLRH